jgi:diguanylate cyclase (GGDEF)-like protein/putative nucleotidyltransferase with HDIG domain
MENCPNLKQGLVLGRSLYLEGAVLVPPQDSDCGPTCCTHHVATAQWIPIRSISGLEGRAYQSNRSYRRNPRKLAQKSRLNGNQIRSETFPRRLGGLSRQILTRSERDASRPDNSRIVITIGQHAHADATVAAGRQASSIFRECAFAQQGSAASFDNLNMKVQINKVLESDKLPSLPQIAVRAIELAQQDEPDLSELVATIRTDPALTAKLLKTANSALFGFRERMSSIDAAVPALGANLVRTLVLSFALARHRSPCPDLDGAYQSVWRRSLTQAVVAESLATEDASSDPNVYFTGGLLLDIGMLALLNAFAGKYAHLILDAKQLSKLCESENDLFDFTHVDVGVELCRTWRFEGELIDAIARHHESSSVVDRTNVSTMSLALVAASQCADYLEQVRRGIPPKQPPALLLDHYCLTFSAIADLMRDVELRVGEVAAMFRFDIGEVPPADEIFLRAKAALEEIAIQSQVEVVVARQEAKQARIKQQHAESQKDSLEQQAYRDLLTGAYNRNFVSSEVETELKRRTDQGLSVGCLFLDIDKFKGLNDTHGHELGDRALAKVSEILHSSVRSSDFVIRYGGDEFLVLLMDSNMSEAKVGKIASRICRRISKARLASKERVRISSSVGAIFYDPQDDTPLESNQLIRQADRAMYDAKNRGGNQVHLCCLTG